MSDILDEKLRQLLARANASAFFPPIDPTGSKGKAVMAKGIKVPKGKEIVFGSTGGGGIKYPWDTWFSPDVKEFPGGLVLIERSEGPENSKGTVVEGTETTKRDYGVPVDAMPPKIKTAARRRYKVVEISRKDWEGNRLENGGFILRSRDMTADERVAEDLLRAEEKAKRAEADDEEGDDTLAGQTQAA